MNLRPDANLKPNADAVPAARHERDHGRMIAVLVAPAMQPRAYVAENSQLTNRIRRHFARIKAGPDVSRPIVVTTVNRESAAAGGIPNQPGQVWGRPGDVKRRMERVRIAKVREFGWSGNLVCQETSGP
jgi:hypothetical protein